MKAQQLWLVWVCDDVWIVANLKGVQEALILQKFVRDYRDYRLALRKCVTSGSTFESQDISASTFCGYECELTTSSLADKRNEWHVGVDRNGKIVEQSSTSVKSVGEDGRIYIKDYRARTTFKIEEKLPELSGYEADDDDFNERRLLWCADFGVCSVRSKM